MAPTPQLTDDGIDTADTNETLADLESQEWLEVVAETDKSVVFRDTGCEEISWWADKIENVDGETLYQEMHDLARKLYDDGHAGDEWSSTDPVVFVK